MAENNNSNTEYSIINVSVKKNIYIYRV